MADSICSEKMFIDDKGILGPSEGSDVFRRVVFSDLDRLKILTLGPLPKSVFEELEEGTTYKVEITEVSE